MKIDKVHVRNFRSIKDEILNCMNLTALVGPNGSGKSSFLKAIELFYNPSPKISEDDFYDRNTDIDIEISTSPFPL